MHIFCYSLDFYQYGTKLSYLNLKIVTLYYLKCENVMDCVINYIFFSCNGIIIRLQFVSNLPSYVYIYHPISVITEEQKNK